MPKKFLKISLLIITGIALLVFLALFIEPNETYITTGTLTLTRNPAVVKQCGSRKQFYSIEVVVVYLDHKKGMANYSFDACHLSGRNPFKERLISCKVEVQYDMGRWFNNRSWLGPALFIHNCIHEPLN
jgi:hypothetical protein